MRSQISKKSSSRAAQLQETNMYVTFGNLGSDDGKGKENVT